MRSGARPVEAVLVTGCSSGIGRASALALLRAGYPVWASARRVGDLRELERAGCRVLELDVTDEAARVAAVRAVEAEHGAVGVLINNAGHGGGGPVEEVPLESVRETFETNLFAVVRMCQLVLPAMRARRSGRIVTIGSAAGLVTPPTGCPYAMTKYALESLSDALRPEVAPFGVRVSLIEPGAVRTRFLENSRSWTPKGAGEGASEGVSAGAGDPYAAYKESVARMVARAHREGARGVLSAEEVAGVVLRAVRSSAPKARYRAGSQARLAPVARRLLGDRGWDAFMRRLVPFPVEAAASRPIAGTR
ncbi:SDR family NAD(P)-dependent oxidoreductase [Phaeacidiphilus oryzae]|uniref:SDR family NAD(P)-dependent oxidoreductase n=1 Tax=Phaeacidiphilus oryzae TaxID=348818 RepID=UPI00055A6537|nr:SDR family NAD(P)-dependent oxidoreductase [Phaeacidiphilus oryzae]